MLVKLTPDQLDIMEKLDLRFNIFDEVKWYEGKAYRQNETRVFLFYKQDYFGLDKTLLRM